MLKVLVFSTAYKPLIGGAEIALREIAFRLRESCEFTIITYRFSRAHPAYEKSAEAEIYRLGGGTLLDRLFIFPFLAFFKGRQLHRKRGFNLFWMMMVSYAGIGGYFLKLLHSKVPMLLTLQEGDSPKHLQWGKLGLLGLWWKVLVNKADFIQTISRYLADRAKVMGAKNVEIVPNGVDVERFERKILGEARAKLRAGLGLSDSDFVAVTASRLARKNAVDVCIAALSYLDKNYKLLVLGEGEERRFLETQAETLGLSGRVIFAGMITHDQLPAYLQSSQVFIRPSRSEGLGNAFLEAMASGIPAVGTPVGGIPDFLTDRQTGLFCKVDDPRDLAEKIRILSSDRQLAALIVENARKLVKAQYSWNSVAVRMEKIFKETANL